MNFKKILKTFLGGVLLFFSALAISFTLYLNEYFHMIYFEQIFYNLLNMESLNIISIGQSVQTVLLGTFIFLAIFNLPLIIGYLFKNLKLEIKIFQRKFNLFPLKLGWYAGILFLICITILLKRIGFFQYIKHQFSNSNLYENYYVAYHDDLITFSEEKQNLIYIFVESFESSIFSKVNGGTANQSYAPNMERLANEEIHFSNTDKLGGFLNINGANWTVAGMVAQTAGIPIYIQTKDKSGNYLEGAVSIGEILNKHGYQNYLMMGSDARFAERKNYFEEHGNYQILDYQYAKNRQWIDQNYFVWWGYEDSKLYEFAKNYLNEISKSDKPFNFTLLTADTHYFNGYTDEQCPKNFTHPYANSFYCMDLQLAQFISWVKQQDFYSNTTIVIVGDHLSMQTDLFESEEIYTRTNFNLFINSKVEASSTKNRIFTAFDMLPSTIASLGGEIEGDRLALGTNLFSNKQTLPEEMGYYEFQLALRKNSKYYKEEILKR